MAALGAAAGARGERGARRRWCRSRGRPRCRCRSRSSGCGSSTGWRAGERAPTTIPLAVRLRGELDRAALGGGARRSGGAAREPAHGVPGAGGVPRQQIAARPARPARGASVESCVAARREPRRAASSWRASCRCGRLRPSTWRDEPLAAGTADPRPRPRREHVLLLVLHHIAGDGWSLGPLCARPCARLPGAGARGGGRAAAAAGAVRRLHAVAARAAGRRGDADSVIARQLAYWRDALPELPEQLELPTDRPRPAVASHRGGSVPLALSSRAARRAARRWRAAAAPACSWCCRPALRRC